MAAQLKMNIDRLALVCKALFDQRVVDLRKVLHAKDLELKRVLEKTNELVAQTLFTYVSLGKTVRAKWIHGDLTCELAMCLCGPQWGQTGVFQLLHHGKATKELDHLAHVGALTLQQHAALSQSTNFKFVSDEDESRAMLSRWATSMTQFVIWYEDCPIVYMKRSAEGVFENKIINDDSELDDYVSFY